MSMSEFESQEREPDLDGDHFSELEGIFPADFSVEDVAFAREMEELFSLEQGEAPPLFAQTLLASEDSRFQAVEPGFELKTRARVFQRLKLKHRLFRPKRTALLTYVPPRVIMMLTAIGLFFMTFTMFVTAPSFASGWSYLWSGPHSGVVQMSNYPSFSLTTSVNAHNADIKTKPEVSDQLTLNQAEAELQFPLSFPSQIPSRYKLSNIYMYGGDQSWSDGPIVILDYSFMEPGVAPRQIAICEFKPRGKVLQVVNDGAAQKIAISPDGDDFAVYVKGQWSSANGSVPSWVYNERSELIEEDADGTVFWIVGDDRDGIDLKSLSSIAGSLQSTAGDSHITTGINRITRSIEETPPILSNDVIYLDDPSNPTGPSFRLIGSQPPQPSHLN